MAKQVRGLHHRFYRVAEIVRQTAKSGDRIDFQLVDLSFARAPSDSRCSFVPATFASGILAQFRFGRLSKLAQRFRSRRVSDLPPFP